MSHILIPILGLIDLYLSFIFKLISLSYKETKKEKKEDRKIIFRFV